MTSSNNKQYGLIIPKKFNINEVKRATVFNDDSDSDIESAEAGTTDWIKKSFQKQVAAQNSGIKRQTEIDMKRALDQDPTVFKYDEIYDDLEKKKADEDKKKTESKKPRYIQKLLQTAQQRKLENERRIERQVQKERDAEGEQFKDKETFVTSAYKKKLEEFHKLDEEERKKDMLEEICDVSKQQDLGGFYRHLYKTTVDKVDSDKEDRESSEKVNEAVGVKKTQRENRQYRKRKSSDSSSLEEGERDSDTSIDSSSSETSVSSKGSSNRSKFRKEKNDEVVTNNDKAERIKSEETNEANETNPKVKSSEKASTSNDVNNQKPDDTKLKETEGIVESKEVVITEVKPKINIWEKRTVGDVFEAALERYFKRKAERLANRGN